MLRSAANLLDIARRRYPEVVRRVSAFLAETPDGGGPIPSAFGIAALADGVEAAIRTGQPRLADGWLSLLRDWARGTQRASLRRVAAAALGVAAMPDNR